MPVTLRRLSGEIPRRGEYLPRLPHSPASRLVMADHLRRINNLSLERGSIPSQRRLDNAGIDQIVFDLVSAPPPPQPRAAGYRRVNRRLREVGWGDKVEVSVPDVADGRTRLVPTIPRAGRETPLRAAASYHGVAGAYCRENDGIDVSSLDQQVGYRHRRPPSSRTSCSGGMMPVRNSEWVVIKNWQSEPIFDSAA